MPLLAENNKPRLLYYLRRRGYRAFSMNRPDKALNKLSVAEREIGGIPNSSEDIKQAHAAAIETYINDHVGMIEEGSYGAMYFNETLNDWSKFDITKRTKHDASISSGLAIMACNRHLYKPNPDRTKKVVNLNIAKYNNKGFQSTIIKQKI
jgi:hypothetical protein